jgi:hypothetical protein
VTQRLGRFNAIGRDWQLWDWVPLMNEGLTAPATVSLSGISTLRLTATGNANLNYIMFVPVTTAPEIQLTAVVENNQIVISFPTVPDATYQLLSSESLVSGSWSVRTNITGHGSQFVIRDNLDGTKRFYRLLSP